jgi:hypothetical protein
MFVLDGCISVKRTNREIIIPLRKCNWSGLSDVQYVKDLSGLDIASLIMYLL